MGEYKDTICVNCIWQDQCKQSVCKTCQYFDNGKDFSTLSDFEIDKIIESRRIRYRKIIWKILETES